MRRNLDLKLSDGSTLKHAKLTVQMLKGRSTFLYGDSGSGKSTMLDHILFLLKDELNLCFVLSGSESSNQFYNGKTPDLLIKSNIVNDKYKVVDWLSTLLRKQKDITEMCTKANDIKNMESLFNYYVSNVKNVESFRCMEKQTAIKTEVMKALEEIEMRFVDDPKKRNEEKKIINDSCDETLRELYKRTIIANITIINDFMRQGKLDLNQEIVATYIMKNPHIGLVIDDCADKFKTWKKIDKENLFAEIVYRSRHYSMTALITTQGDKEFDSELRINAYNSIFTSENLATLNFTRTSNGYNNMIIKEAKRIIPQLFAQPDPEHKHFRKLVCSKVFPNEFRYTVADLIFEPYRIGSKKIWDTTEKALEKLEQGRESSNPLMKKLKKRK